MGGTGTWFGDVLDFDGVGVAIEPEDCIVLRHCGGFTIHREKGWARDGEAREGEGKSGDTSDESTIGIQLAVVDRGRETKSNQLFWFLYHNHPLPDLSQLHCRP